MRGAWLAVLLVPAAAGAAPRPEPILGCTVPSWWHDAYGAPRTRESLTELAATGATWVAFSPTVFVVDRTSAVIVRTPASATDESLVTAIRAAHARGLKVLLKPHVDSLGDRYRFVINPSDPDAWFASYWVYLKRWAEIARDEKVEMLSVGTELAILAAYPHRDRWRRLIAETRKVYPGPLTYASNSHAVHLASFWDDLDYIGVDAYYSVPGGKDVSALRTNWRTWVLSMGAVAARHKKPLLYTEFGVTSQSGANLRPWDWSEFGELDMETQAAGYQAAFEAAANEPWFAGMLCWDWNMDPRAGGPEDRSHNVNNKPAAETLRRLFAAVKRPSPPPPASVMEAIARAARRLAGLPPKFD